jgi:hypothetical protein
LTAAIKSRAVAHKKLNGSWWGMTLRNRIGRARQFRAAPVITTFASRDEGTAMVRPYAHGVEMMNPMGRRAERQLSTHSVALLVLSQAKVSSAAGFWSVEATCRRPMDRQA